jgi:hypothetical protein
LSSQWWGEDVWTREGDDYAFKLTWSGIMASGMLPAVAPFPVESLTPAPQKVALVDVDVRARSAVLGVAASALPAFDVHLDSVRAGKFPGFGVKTSAQDDERSQTRGVLAGALRELRESVNATFDDQQVMQCIAVASRSALGVVDRGHRANIALVLKGVAENLGGKGVLTMRLAFLQGAMLKVTSQLGRRWSYRRKVSKVRGIMEDLGLSRRFDGDFEVTLDVKLTELLG